MDAEDMKNLEMLYESYENMVSPEKALENMYKLIQGIKNYVDGMAYKLKQNPNDIGNIEDIGSLNKGLTKQLNWARNFSAPEDSTYYTGPQ